MNKVRDGIWQWTAPHPAWKEGVDWDRLVSSYALDDGRRLYLIDPLDVPSEVLAMAAQHGRDATLIVLTCPWHRRDVEKLAAELDAHVFVPHPDGSDQHPVHGSVYTSGDKLSGGIEVYPGMESNDLVLWFPSFGAVVAGDTLIERDGKLTIPTDWIDSGRNSLQNIKHQLRPLLELAVEVVLPTHGDPKTADDLRAALG
jgi:glyoxylase-like metal-dependent hydrolase (beta-lactamase superfamily II)